MVGSFLGNSAFSRLEKEMKKVKLKDNEMELEQNLEENIENNQEKILSQTISSEEEEKRIQFYQFNLDTKPESSKKISFNTSDGDLTPKTYHFDTISNEPLSLVHHSIDNNIAGNKIGILPFTMKLSLTPSSKRPREEEENYSNPILKKIKI